MNTRIFAYMLPEIQFYATEEEAKQSLDAYHKAVDTNMTFEEMFYECSADELQRDYQAGIHWGETSVSTQAIINAMF